MYFEDMIQTSLNDRLDRTKTMLQVQFTVENMFSYGSYVQHSPHVHLLALFLTLSAMLKSHAISSFDRGTCLSYLP